MIEKALFIEAIRKDKTVPELLREHADKVETLEERQFDESYLGFLDEQIRLSPRGPKWTEVLKCRRAALSGYSNMHLFWGKVGVGNLMFTIRVHPELRTVILWEQWPLSDGAQ